MATADLFGALLQSLTDERANATSEAQWLANASPIARREWALEVLQVEASHAQLAALAVCGGASPSSSPTVPAAAIEQLAATLISDAGRLAAAERRLRAEAQHARLSQSMQRHYNWDEGRDTGYGALGNDEGGSCGGDDGVGGSGLASGLSAAPQCSEPCSVDSW